MLDVREGESDEGCKYGGLAPVCLQGAASRLQACLHTADRGMLLKGP